MVQPIGGLQQRRAIATPPPGQRKLVLATNIAESSLTIDGVNIVIDSGLERTMVFDARNGSSRLHTQRLSAASAAQRAGRAGRVAEGVAYRLWTKGEEGALQAYPPAEIETADLAGLALELALWGATPEDLPFLSAPNPGAFAEAQAADIHGPTLGDRLHHFSI